MLVAVGAETAVTGSEAEGGRDGDGDVSIAGTGGG